MRDVDGRLFWIATEDEIKSGKTTDVYLRYANEVLRKKGIDPVVVMEVYARSLPEPWSWGILTGTYEVAKKLEGLPLDVMAMDEGELFFASSSAIYEPVLQVRGRYQVMCEHENSVLGFLCKSTGISSKSARVRIAAGEKKVLSFGTRRSHPALAPTIERSAFIGGLDSVSNVLGAELLGDVPVGTMPHSLIICFEDEVACWKAFDEVLPPEVPRVALVDTYGDEKSSSVKAWRTLGEKLSGVRIDTVPSRRGNLRKILEEVRWELNANGAHKVKIILSGGLDEFSVAEVRDLVDSFGVGTSIADAETVNFSMKIVEKEEGNKFCAKRGDISGAKQVYRDWRKMQDIVSLAGNDVPDRYTPLLKPLLQDGKIVAEFKNVREIRESVLEKLNCLTVPFRNLTCKTPPPLNWKIER